jgi:nicotinate-nucleotide adenylyltransferase
MSAIGILGGTFDPVHNAHLAMARAALEHLGLDKVLFMPTGNQKYRQPAIASDAHRVAMLRLALDDPRFALDARELAPGFSGYTVDTLLSLKREDPSLRLTLLMGADQHAKLDTWHQPEKVRALARIAVFARPGARADGKIVPFKEMPISSTDIRARAARGESLDGLVPPAVANYIAREHLYQ